MKNKITTMRGMQIDMNALRERHGATVAIGNAKMNAAGDILGRNGDITKTHDEIVRNYYENNPKAVVTTAVSLKDISDEILTPAEAVEALKNTAPKPRRKMKDSED